MDTEYIILENIYDSADQKAPLRQRDMAQIAGASLGMTNSILKRLAQKGWITVKKLNNRNIQYAITIEGINEILRRSYRYFKRTIKNVVFYKDILDDVLYRSKLNNIKTVVLVGSSDLDFIVEHSCRRWSLNFTKNSGDLEPDETPGVLKIFSEGIASPHLKSSSSANIFYLSGLIIKQAASEHTENYSN